jgi:hypothetical protein
LNFKKAQRTISSGFFCAKIALPCRSFAIKAHPFIALGFFDKKITPQGFAASGRYLYDKGENDE